MTKNVTFFVLTIFTLFVKAQSPVTPPTQTFGRIDTADLKLTSCDFEKDANAMVLFDLGDAYYSQTGATLDHHVRIKIFNEKGRGEANIRIEYFSINTEEYISGLEAETINLSNGKIEITNIDKKQIYTQHIDAFRSAIAFSFPNVKPGSVLEFKYRLNTQLLNIPNWYFQSGLPERYNEITTSIPSSFFYKTQLHTYQPFAKDIITEQGTLNKHTRAMANVASFSYEPLMSSLNDNIQSAYFQITGIQGYANFKFLFDTWDKAGKYFIDVKYLGYEMNINLSGQKEILKNAKLLSTNNQKIAFIFNEVKNIMRWNNIDTWYTNNGVNAAWDSKTGNATEINLILHSLLVSAGIEAYPFMVSTHKHGKINPAYPSIQGFNRAVVYVPTDNGKFFILDASGKYNTYNEIPGNLLNSFGLLIDNEHKIFKTIYIDNEEPVKEAIFIIAEIMPNGSVDGTTQKSSFSYHKGEIAENYKKNGEEKYIEFLKDKNNNLHILNLKIENPDIDSLPLKENISFKMVSPESDGNYIYFNPNIFSPFKVNPFLSVNRLTDIDFSYLNSYSSTGIYKMPADYKAETLPKSVRMTMPDKGISFTRIIAQQEGVISVRYTVDYHKSVFVKENYAELKEFYRKMYEMLNEPIVLKKSS